MKKHRRTVSFLLAGVVLISAASVSISAFCVDSLPETVGIKDAEKHIML